MPGYHLPVTFETAADARIVGITNTGTGIDHDVDVGQLMLVMAKGFPDQAFDSIASDRVADQPSGRRQSEARPIVAAAADEQSEHCVTQPPRVAIDAVELRFVVKSLGRGEWAGKRKQFRLRNVALMQRAAAKP